MVSKGDSDFPTTQWTLIARLRSEDEGISRQALEALCVQYHYPLYCYIRQRGLAHHDAQDALQDFFAKLLRLGSLKNVDMTKGRLRSFLAVSLRRFISNWRRDGLRRRMEISLEDVHETRFRQEQFSSEVTPEMALERVWAATLLRSALDDLAAAEMLAGRRATYTALEPFLSPLSGSANYPTVATSLGVTEVAVRQAVKRLREKFRKHLRRRVAETLAVPKEDQIDEEMMALRAVLTG